MRDLEIRCASDGLPTCSWPVGKTLQKHVKRGRQAVNFALRAKIDLRSMGSA